MYPPKKQKLSNFTYIFLSAGAGTGVVRVDHKKPSAGAVRVKNDGSFCTLGVGVEPRVRVTPTQCQEPPLDPHLLNYCWQMRAKLFFVKT